MKLINILLFFVFFCCGPTIVSAQYISVDDTQTAIALVNILTNNSSCSNASGEDAKGDTFTPGKKSYGSFTYTGSNFPFTKGIVLSTWSSTNSEGPYLREPSSNPESGSINWEGDTDLETALALNSTINASFLEFDFIPLTNSISFNYIFASNEYLDNFSCDYSDGFAFLIKERDTPGSIYKNLAVIPGTSTPVSSMNIHPQLYPPSAGSQSKCDPNNETYFNGYNSSTSPINYTGQTKVMNAQTSVIAGRTYHIKLVIADHRNEYFNSAVFLEAGSFSPQVDLGPDLLIANDNAICFGESHLLDTKLTASDNTYKWFKDGSLTPILGAEGPSYLVSDAGTYKVEVAFSSATCTASDDIKIEFYPEISLTDTTLTQCDNNGNGVAIFDLTKADNTIKNNDATLITVVYYESLADAKGKTNAIPNPSSYTYKPAIPIVYARVTNTKGCADYAELKLFISNKTIAPQDPILSCDGDKQDGLYHFDLDAEVSPQVLSGILTPGLQVEYYLNISDAMTQKNELPNIFNNTIPNEQIIFARIVNGADCYKITPITLVVSAFDPLLFQDELATMCEESSKQLSVSTGYTSYLWTTNENSNAIRVTSPGEYLVTVTDENGCEITKKFTVNISQIATITGVTVNDFAGKENSVLIQYTGNSSYEFSIDGFNFQDDPLFEGVAPASYYATARDKNGCGLSELFQFYVMDYPRFFTPNGDNYNDVWEIKNINIYPNFSLSIFDRYGKLLQQLNSANPSWNGTFNSHSLPATDYWFDLRLEEDKIIKGHFSLKR